MLHFCADEYANRLAKNRGNTCADGEYSAKRYPNC